MRIEFPAQTSGRRSQEQKPPWPLHVLLVLFCFVLRCPRVRCCCLPLSGCPQLPLPLVPLASAIPLWLNSKLGARPKPGPHFLSDLNLTRDCDTNAAPVIRRPEQVSLPRRPFVHPESLEPGGPIRRERLSYTPPNRLHRGLSSRSQLQGPGSRWRQLPGATP